MTLDEVVDVFRRWMHLPDPGILYATLATVAANRMPGDPVWLLLVGPPGSGKTETIGALATQPDVHPAATLTEASLLSGTPKKEADAAGGKGGLLRAIGGFGILTVKDFTSVLAMNRDSRSQILAALREVYDGSWTRHVGTDGGRTLHWEGKVGLIGGCTGAIDGHHAVMASMGERVLLYRLPPVNDHAQGGSALAHAGSEHAMRADLTQATSDLFAGITGWHLPPRDLTQAESERLVNLASFAARCRSAVERDRTSREIELIPAPEAPGRLVIQLRNLLGGLEIVGVNTADAWRALTETTLGCIPAVRRTVLGQLAAAATASTTSDIASAVGYPTGTVRRTLEDLACHGVVIRYSSGEGRADWFQLTEWATDHWPSESVPASPESRSAMSPLIHPSPAKEGIAGTVTGNGHAPSHETSRL